MVGESGQEHPVSGGTARENLIVFKVKLDLTRPTMEVDIGLVFILLSPKIIELVEHWSSSR